MKIYMVEQRSDAWRQLRLGIPTSSNFHKIVTPKKCELSKGATDYALRLCAERLLNMTSESSIDNPWMERGIALEADAVRQFEFQYDVATIPVGFVTNDEGSIGCSPDRLVLSDERIAVEIKTPAPHVHLGYLLFSTDEAYLPQVMGQILVAELDRAILYSFNPQSPPAAIEHTPDKTYLAKLSEALKMFNADLNAMTERARALGVYQPMPRATTPVEAVEMHDLARQFRAESADRMLKSGFDA